VSLMSAPDKCRHAGATVPSRAIEGRRLDRAICAGVRRSGAPLSSPEIAEIETQ